jgi:hypothetical protein
VQAVLQAAYLRQLLGVPPARSRHPAPADGSGSGAVDMQRAVAESSQKARSSLKPFISEVRHCCQCAAALRCVLLTAGLLCVPLCHSVVCAAPASPVALHLRQQRAERRAVHLPACPPDCSFGSRAGSWRPSC